jgi:hypothetical protein
MIYDNSNPASRPLPPAAPAKSKPVSGPLPWIFGTVLLVVACSVASWGLMQTNDTVINNIPTGAAPASK